MTFSHNKSKRLMYQFRKHKGICVYNGCGLKVEAGFAVCKYHHIINKLRCRVYRLEKKLKGLGARK